jgi:hypothetical protein
MVNLYGFHTYLERTRENTAGRELKAGGPKTINCEDGTTRSCPSGTQECYDNSDYYCRPMMGGDKTITCEDGTTRICGAGTQECYDNSDYYCGQEAPTIECADGTTVLT